MKVRFLKDNKKLVFFNVVLIIFFILMVMHNFRRHPIKESCSSDTIVKYIHVNETIVGRHPVIIKYKLDTFWITKKEYIPDSNYSGLLEQYRKLGNQYFMQNTYSTTFSLDTLGSVTVIDTVQTNSLIGNTLITDLIIPEKTITIIKNPSPKRQFYVGAGITANNIFISSEGIVSNVGIQAGVLYKDRKDRIIGANVGYDGKMNYSLNTYWKVKIK